MGKLTKEEHQALSWVSKQGRPVWGGIYQRGGEGDPVVAYLLREGLIEGVAHNHTVGKHHFGGGYRITPAGRAALKERSNEA